MNQIKFRKVRENAIVPTYATDGSGAFDLYASQLNGADRSIGSFVEEGYGVYCATGIAVEIPPGYGMLILSRSGHGFKHDVRLANCVGLIDSDYRGEIQVKLTMDKPGGSYLVGVGDRIAQGIIIPLPKWEFVEVEELSSTERGEGGFGSTGVK